MTKPRPAADATQEAPGVAPAAALPDALYRQLFEHDVHAWAFHRMVVDADGRPVDYVFLAANEAFERQTGLERGAIIGRRVTEVLPGIERDPGDWIGRYGRVALQGEEIRFQEFSAPLQRWYDVKAFSPARGTFAVTFSDVTDAKRVEHALRDAHDMLRRHVTATPLAVVEWGADYRVTSFSPRAEALFGWSAEEVIGKRIDEIPWVPEEDWPSVRAVMDDMRTGARASNVNANRNVRKDGSIVHCEWYNSALHDESGGLVSMLSLVLDVTPRVRLEEELRRQADMLRLAHDAIFLWRLGGAIESWNLGAEELYGYSADEARGRVSHELLGTVHPVPWPRIEQQLRDRGRWAGELVHRTRDGRSVTVSAKLQLLRGDDGVERVLEANRDITDRKAAEARAEYLARFPQENPDPVLRLSRDLAVVYANDAAESLLRALGPGEGGAAPPALAAPARQVAADGCGLRTEIACGSSFFALHFVPVGDEVNVYGQDVTARRRAEEAVREADRRKSEFLAVLSHELRNPLAPILNSVAILERMGDPGEHARRGRAVIQRQAMHLSRLVDDLLDITRIERGKVELARGVLDAREVVRRTVEDHRPTFEQRGIASTLEAPGAPVWVDADPTRLAQVVGNLLHNAAKFTPAGGTVSTAVRATADRVEIRVRDDGAGIAPELLDRLFAPFVQGDAGAARVQGGLGLGLALVRSLVELHGGSVRARSAGPGRGSEFVISLPLAEAPRALAPAAAVRSTPRRRILLVEDNVDAGDTLAELLALDGHEVRVARDGRSGLALARAFRPEVVICDVGLPDMTGYDVARELRRDEGLRSARLVALTGYALPDDRRRAEEAGFDRHLPKPPPLAELAALLADERPAD